MEWKYLSIPKRHSTYLIDSQYSGFSMTRVNQTFWCHTWDNPKLGQNHGCRCLGSLYNVVISSHAPDYITFFNEHSPRHTHITSMVPNTAACGSYTINTLRPRQNGGLCANDIFTCIFLNEKVWISINISLKSVPKGQINYIPVLVQIMAWHPSGDKLLSEPMLFSLLMHICVTWPQWVIDWLVHVIWKLMGDDVRWSDLVDLVNQGNSPQMALHWQQYPAEIGLLVVWQWNIAGKPERIL